MNRLAQIVIFCVLAYTFVACAPKSGPRQSSEGGQHGGGGDHEKSTVEQVNKALDQALALASATDYRNNIFAKYFIARNVSYIDEISAHGRVPKFIIFPELRPELVGQEKFREIFFFDITKSPLAIFGDKTRIQRLESGRCKAPDKSHPTASVSELSMNAQICFSITELRTIPHSALLRQILGLIIHEAVHMMGQKEFEAKSHQADFLKYFETVEAETKNLDVETRAFNVSLIARYYLQQMEKTITPAQTAKDSPPKDGKPAPGENSKIEYSLLLQKLKKLFSDGLKISLDPVRMQLATNPARPELYDNFARALLDVVFESSSLDGKWELSTFTPARVEFEQRLNTLLRNTFAYLQGKQQAVCVNPNYAKAVAVGLFDSDVGGPPGPLRPGTFLSEMPNVDTRLTKFKTDLPLFTFPPEGPCEVPVPQAASPAGP